MVKANGYNSVLTNRARSKDLYTRMGASADLTYYASAGGQHTFKGGVQFERIANDVADIEQQPHVTVLEPVTDDACGRVERGTYGYWSWRQFGTLGKVNVNNLGLFFQDAWTVNSKLTLNLGVRTEKEDVPSYRANLDGINFSFADKFAPRAGFAYDIKGDGRWKAYGSWGIFYDVMKLELPRGAFGGDVWVEDYYTLDTLEWPTLMVNGNKPGRSSTRWTSVFHRTIRHAPMRRDRSGVEAVQAAGAGRRHRARAHADARGDGTLCPQAG